MKKFNGGEALPCARDGKPTDAEHRVPTGSGSYTQPNLFTLPQRVGGHADPPLRRLDGMEPRHTGSVRSHVASVELLSLALTSGFLRAQVDLGLQFRERLSPARLLAQLLVAELFLIHFRFSREHQSVRQPLQGNHRLIASGFFGRF